MNKDFAEIALDLPVRKTFSYAVPPGLQDRMAVGKRVRAPFGKRTVEGYCVGFIPEPEYDRVRDVIEVLDEDVLIDDDILWLTKWISDYYRCSWGEALSAALPMGVRSKAGVRVKRLVCPKIGKEELEKTASGLERRAPSQASALRVIRESDGNLAAGEVARRAGCSASTLNALARKGLIAFREEKATQDPLIDVSVERTQRLKPTAEQRVALARIKRRLRQGQFGVVLVHGVNDSGKTEVYLQAIEEVIKAGKQAIVLVPEISLTPQTIRRFRGRFQPPEFRGVGVLHSRMTAGEMHLQWRAVKEGKVDVVLGVRSAIFAPVRNLGLIVVDEEHESTFKQDNAPRYHVRDAAVMRGKRADCVVLLGSATPSLESYQNACIGKYELVRLTKRVRDRPTPTVEVVDMRHEHRAQKRFTHFSRRLVDCLRSTLRRGEQAVLFLNRKGFATIVRCRVCGYVMSCERCGIVMTFYKAREMALCNQCGAKRPTPSSCPECGDPKPRYLGAGTERVEAFLAGNVPEAKAVRMDSESTRKRGSHRELLDGFRDGVSNVLVGTQMIAKGLDFPEVTLVGVMNADSALHLQDFRASERTFQLLWQVSGRAGRGKKAGIVVIQTHRPQHYCVSAAAAQDYEEFAREELRHRRLLWYPPYCRLARIVVRGRALDRVKSRCAEIVKALRETGMLEPRGLLGPAEAPIGKVKGKHRWHILVKANHWKKLQSVLDLVAEELEFARGVQVAVDVDPVTML